METALSYNLQDVISINPLLVKQIFNICFQKIFSSISEQFHFTMVSQKQKLTCYRITRKEATFMINNQKWRIPTSAALRKVEYSELIVILLLLYNLRSILTQIR